MFLNVTLYTTASDFIGTVASSVTQTSSDTILNLRVYLLTIASSLFISRLLIFLLNIFYIGKLFNLFPLSSSLSITSNITSNLLYNSFSNHYNSMDS